LINRKISRGGTNKMAVYLARPARPRRRPRQTKYRVFAFSVIFIIVVMRGKIRSRRKQSGRSIMPMALRIKELLTATTDKNDINPDSEKEKVKR